MKSPLITTLSLLCVLASGLFFGCSSQTPTVPPITAEPVGILPTLTSPPISPTATPQPIAVLLTPSAPTATEADLFLRPVPSLPGETPSTEPTPVPPTPTLSPPAAPSPRGKSIFVDQATQLMHLFEDGAWLRTLPISTGTPEFYTPAFEGTVRFYLPTIYSVDGLSADHAWYLFYNAGRIYIHGAPYTLGVNGEKLYEGLEFLGVTPSSHGCIRVHPDDAAWLTEWNPGGAVIHITQPRR